MGESAFNEITFAVYDDADITDNLDRHIRSILVECFPHNEDNFSRTRGWHTNPSWVVVGMDVDGTIVSHCAIVERTISVGNPARLIRVAGVQGFSVRPKWRKMNISDRMMEIAVFEAKRKGLDAGLLFCLPVLEKLYSRMGWQVINSPVMVRNEPGTLSPLPEKNIAMIIPLNQSSFPYGIVDLMGQDW
jgi:hypothetical protein